MKQGFDLLRMVSNVIESAEERVTKILRSFKEAIVRDILTRVVPDSFGRIQFRRVGTPVRWKLEDFQIATVRFEPGIGFLFFMIRSIILNQIDPGGGVGRRRARPPAPEKPDRSPTENSLPDAGRRHGPRPAGRVPNLVSATSTPTQN